MTDDIDSYSKDLVDATDDLKAGILGLEKVKAPEAKSSAVTKLLVKLKIANDLYRQFTHEFNELKGKQQAKYNEQSVEFKIALTEVKASLEKHQAGSKRVELGLEKEQKTTSELLKSATSHQDKSLSSVATSSKLVSEIEAVGAATLVTIVKDSADLEKAIDKVDAIQSELSTAKKQIIGFALSMAKDKLVRAFLVVILLGALFVLIYANVKANAPAPTATPV